MHKMSYSKGKSSHKKSGSGSYPKQHTNDNHSRGGRSSLGKTNPSLHQK